MSITEEFAEYAVEPGEPAAEIAEAAEPDGGTKAEPEKAEKERSAYPTYKVEKVAGGLPDNVRAEYHSDGRFFVLLGEVAKDPGEWYEVAHYVTDNGASTARKSLRAGERKIPDGEWEFEVRRIDSGEKDAKGKTVRHSKLYARYLG